MRSKEYSNLEMLTCYSEKMETHYKVTGKAIRRRGVDPLDMRKTLENRGFYNVSQNKIESARPKYKDYAAFAFEGWAETAEQVEDFKVDVAATSQNYFKDFDYRVEEVEVF